MTHRRIILTGFMGTGKSTVGRLLAKRLDCAFVDTDELIVARAGRSIPEIFRKDGEAGFRQWERLVAQELSSLSDVVIATGGRMMLDEENARALGADSYVFCLAATPEVIAGRLADDGGNRPLLNGPDAAGRIHDLMDERRAQYARFPQIDTDGKSIDHIVEEIVQCISVT